MKKLSAIFKALAVLSAAAMLVLCGCLVYFSQSTAARANNSVIVCHRDGVFAAPPPEVRAGDTYSELARETEGDAVTVLEIEKRDGGIFYRHMLYGAAGELYPKDYTVRTDAEAVSLSEIRAGIRSLSPLAVLIPPLVLSLCMSLIAGFGIYGMAEREPHAVRKFVLAAVIFPLSLAAICLASARIDIPNSLLPSENIFDLSHYRSLYVSLREMVRAYGLQKSSLGALVERLPFLFTLFQYEVVFALCFAVTAGCGCILQKRRKA